MAAPENPGTASAKLEILADTSYSFVADSDFSFKFQVVNHQLMKDDNPIEVHFDGKLMPAWMNIRQISEGQYELYGIASGEALGRHQLSIFVNNIDATAAAATKHIAFFLFTSLENLNRSYDSNEYLIGQPQTAAATDISSSSAMPLTALAVSTLFILLSARTTDANADELFLSSSGDKKTADGKVDESSLINLELILELNKLFNELEDQGGSVQEVEIQSEQEGGGIQGILSAGDLISISIQLNQDENVQDNPLADPQSASAVPTGRNVPPTVNDDFVFVTESGLIEILPLENDIDVNPNDELLITALNIISGNGIITQDENELVFNTNLAFEQLGVEQTDTTIVVYTVTDARGLSADGKITITIQGENDIPIAFDDVLFVTENQTGEINVLLNDFDIDQNDTLANFSLDSIILPDIRAFPGITPSNLGVFFNPGTNYDFLPVEITLSVPTIPYVMSDDSGAASSANLTIFIQGLNDPPVANPDTELINENEAKTLNVLANDTDVDSNDGPQNFSLDNILFVSGPSNPDGIIPTGNFSIDVVKNTFLFDPGTDFDFLPQEAVDDDAAIVTFNYEMSDDSGATSQSTITLTIEGLNDAPVAVDDKLGDALDITENNPQVTINVLNNDMDVDSNDDVSNFSLDNVTFVSGPINPDGIMPTGNFSIDVVNNTFLFDPGNAFDFLAIEDNSADVVFQYQMSDNGGLSSTATITITLRFLNDAPVIVDDVFNLTEDQTSGSFNVLLNDTDIDNFDDPSTFILTGFQTPAENLDTMFMVPLGNNTLTFDLSQTSFTQNGNIVDFSLGNVFDTLAEGDVISYPMNFTYTMTDDTDIPPDNNLGQVTVNIIGVNDAPVAVDDIRNRAIDANETVNINVLANDSDIDHSDIISIIATDNTVDPDNPGLGMITPSGSDVIFNPGTDFDFLPANTSITYIFNYTIQDTPGATDTAMVTVTINGINDAPTAVTDAGFIISEESNNLIIDDVLDNDFDIDQGDTFAFIMNPISNPNGLGNISLDANNNIIFVAQTNDVNTNFDFLGVDAFGIPDIIDYSFFYTIEDSNGAQGVGEVIVTVVGVNDAPVAVDDNFILTENQDGSIPINVISNDTDVDDDNADLELVDFNVLPANQIPGVSFTQNGNEIAVDFGNVFDSLGEGESFEFPALFGYEVRDDNGASDTGQFAITVNGVNDAPEISTDAMITHSAGTGPQIIDSTITISDVDNTDLSGATVAITQGYDPMTDTLNYDAAFASANGITANIISFGAAIAFSGTADLNVYEQLLETVTFEADASAMGDRTIEFIINDGSSNNNNGSSITELHINWDSSLMSSSSSAATSFLSNELTFNNPDNDYSADGQLAGTMEALQMLNNTTSNNDMPTNDMDNTPAVI